MTFIKFFAAFLALFVVPCYAELVVVANPDAPVRSFSKEDVARIYLKKTKTFPNGEEVVPLSQPDFPEKDAEFFMAITGKSRVQLSAYWARLMFTGKGRPPLDGENDQKILQKITEDAKYIGYIDASNLDGSVKVLYRLK